MGDQDDGDRDVLVTIEPLPHWSHVLVGNGIHGDRALWKIYKVEELDVLANTIQQLM